MNTAELNTGWFTLAYPKGNKWELILNGSRPFKAELDVLLSDRKANGDAFPGEAVCELWTHVRWNEINSQHPHDVAGWVYARKI